MDLSFLFESQEPVLKTEPDYSDDDFELPASRQSSFIVASASQRPKRNLERELSTSSRDSRQSLREIPDMSLEPIRIKEEEFSKRHSLPPTSPKTSHEDHDDSDTKRESSEELSEEDKSPSEIKTTLKELRRERSIAQSNVSGQKRKVKALQQDILNKDIEIQRQSYRIEDFSEIKKEIFRKWHTAKKVREDLTKEKIDTETNLQLAKDIRQRDEEALKGLNQRIFHLEEKLQQLTNAEADQGQPKERKMARKKRKCEFPPVLIDTCEESSETKIDIRGRRRRMTKQPEPLELYLSTIDETLKPNCPVTKPDGMSVDTAEYQYLRVSPDKDLISIQDNHFAFCQSTS